MQRITFYKLTSIWSLLITLTLTAPQLTAQATLTLKDSIGTGNATTANGDINGPAGIAIDNNGNIFIAEFSGDRISKFDKNGTFVKAFGSIGTGNGQMEQPFAIATDSQGNVFVVDNKNSRVQKFDNDGNYVSQFGTAGAGNGQFNNPIGIAIDAADNIYVVDQNNDRVQKFTAGGVFIRVFGTSGTPTLRNPRYITVDTQANVYVGDGSAGIKKVVKYDSTGTVLSTFGTGQTLGDGGLDTPQGIAVDSQGNLYVAESKNDSVHVFKSDASFIKKFKIPGDLSQEIIFDSNGSLYVVDFTTNKVYIYTTPQEINLKTGTTSIASGSTVDYGSVVVSQNSAKDFTLENLGGLDLTLSGTTGSQVVLGGTNASDFTVTQTNVTDKITGFSNVTFTVTFTPSGLGAKTATLTIASDDADEGTYTVNLTGTAASNVTGLPTNLANGHIKVGPVPTLDVLNLTIEGRASNNISYKIIDLQGRMTSQGAGVAKNGKLNLDVSQLRSGNYLLILKVGNETVIRRLQKN